jgi:hypothetical protein
LHIFSHLAFHLPSILVKRPLGGRFRERRGGALDVSKLQSAVQIARMTRTLQRCTGVKRVETATAAGTIARDVH